MKLKKKNSIILKSFFFVPSHELHLIFPLGKINIICENATEATTDQNRHNYYANNYDTKIKIQNPKSPKQWNLNDNISLDIF